jgi:hypothetical protein
VQDCISVYLPYVKEPRISRHYYKLAVKLLRFLLNVKVRIK